MAVITVEHEAIRYITGDLKDIGLKEYVIKRLHGNYHVQEFWANKDITFSLNKGDMLGIIGSNGAGKSTLLKGISGVLAPTKGKIRIKGKIAALLELASGFDGNLTVRENTYLRGALLGYTRQFMNKKYDEIIAFAELQDFQDRQFKQLSSGMRSRLAFSIASLVDPDILILDEVLSVGDGAFRKKSGDKMREILSRGVTGILVSHSISQIREMCNKILWLDHGNQICFSADTDIICDAYEEFLVTKILPTDQESIVMMAAAHAERLAKKEIRDAKAEQKAILAVLNSSTPEVAVKTARRFIKQQVAKQKALAEAQVPHEPENG